METEIKELQRFKYVFDRNQASMQNVVEPQGTYPNFYNDCRALYKSGYSVSCADTLLPSLNISVTSKQHGTHAWQMYFLHGNRPVAWLKSYAMKLRQARMGSSKIQKPMGINNPHTTSSHRAGEDLRNVVWFDPENYVFMSFNRGAIMRINKALETEILSYVS